MSNYKYIQKNNTMLEWETVSSGFFYGFVRIQRRNVKFTRYTYKKVHIWVSLALFASSLVFSGYYIGEGREPQLSFLMLLLGWGGIYGGHFSWFANLFYFLSLKKNITPKISSLFAFIALLFALSFLLHKDIIVSEAPSYASITSYGWGYFLWVTSIGVLLIGQFFRSSPKYKNITSIATQLIWLIFVFSVFFVHYYLGDESQYSIDKKRNIVFEEKCKSAVEYIYSRPHNVKGIFFNGGMNSRFEKDQLGNWHNSGGTAMGVGWLNGGYIKFYEILNRNSTTEKNFPYIRYVQGSESYTQIEKQVSNLESEYAVITTFFDIPKVLNVYGAEITIKSLNDNIILAKTTYVYNKHGKELCAHKKSDVFSISEFLNDVFNLSKKY